MLVDEWNIRVPTSCDKQFHLCDLVGDLDWQFDLASGALSFGPHYNWRTQLLGTESEYSDTWLWAWANPVVRAIPEALLIAAHTMKGFGRERVILELTEPEVPLTVIDGHILALLASSVCRADAYFRCPFEGGALFVLIKDETFPKCPDPPLARIASVFPQVISSFDIPDHQLAFTGYLADYDLHGEQEGNRIVVKEASEPVLTATFDERNRLTNLEVRLESADSDESVPDESESWDQAQLRRIMGW